MSRQRVSLSKKHAEALLEALDGEQLSPFEALALEALRIALEPKPVKKYAPQRKLPKKAPGTGTKEIRATLWKRADEKCEACGSYGMGGNPLEMDHFFGRAKAPQSIENCWLLCRQCHHEKTNSRPSAMVWFAAFVRHCDTYGYRVEAKRARNRFEALQLSREDKRGLK